MNIPNTITVIRLCLVPVFLFFMTMEGLAYSVLALAVFLIASFSDLIDGMLARKWNLETEFGKLMDPIADKVLICSALLVFLKIEYLFIPVWVIVIIIAREFLITGFRIYALGGGQVIASEKAGKLKTTSQVSAIILTLLVVITKNYAEVYLSWNPFDVETQRQLLFWWCVSYTPFILLLISAVLSVFSGVTFIINNRNIFYGKKG